MRSLATYTRFAALLAVGITWALGLGAARAGGAEDDVDRLAQMAELEHLHATFHAAASVHDPVNGDSEEVITQRIRDVLGIWERDGVLTIYFECHYFNVELNPATGLPFWTAVSHVDLVGEARKIDGRWLLTHDRGVAVPVPVP